MQINYQQYVLDYLSLEKNIKIKQYNLRNYCYKLHM